MFIHKQIVKTKIGELIIASYDNHLCILDFNHRKMRQTVDHRIQKSLATTFVEKNSDVIKTTMQQLDEYLNVERQFFEIPMLMLGSDFQKKVWNALLAIPYGTTISYLQLAKNINHQKAVRPVASANGANAMAIVIPCHRVIGTNGELVGYGGGLTAKKQLLALEQKQTGLFDKN